MKLVIVESPSKAKTIQKYLGRDYKVMASGGHVCDLPQKTLGIDIDNRFKPEYVITDAKKKDLLKRMKKEVKDSEFTYLATDPDREGEAISWHLANNLDLNGQKNRIEFNEITAKAVQKAIQQPREINMNLVDAQQARRVLDRLVGYKVSPILSRKIKSGLSGGRVQSAALKMIVDREREINAFVPQEYWNVCAELIKPGTKSPVIKGSLQDVNGTKLKLDNESAVKEVVSKLETADWSVDKVKKGVSRSKPAAPFTTSTLQQDGSQKLGLTAPQIMLIAQQLYEGIELPGEGHTALVTYIRTDSVRISSDMQAATISYIKDRFGEAYAPVKPNVYTSKGQNVQDAHEAIRPVSLDRTPESLEDKLPRNQYRLYKLIYYRYLASQMTDATYNTMTVRISARTSKNEDYGFKVSGKSLVFKGYTAVYETEKNTADDDDSSESTLPNLNEGEKLNLKNIKTEQKFTKPQPRYSEATLIKAMEENGIGRPSTYATVISVLTKREYVTKEQKLFKPTPLGETVTEFMEEWFKNIVDIHFTASMEDKLDLVERGAEWQKIIEDFYPSFEKELKEANYNGKKRSPLPEEVSDVICEKCGARMVVKEGRYGKFLACPNYPECKNVKNIVESVGKCPICGGDISKRYSKAGRVFYGCSNYPACKFMSWDIPAPILCPKCGKTMKIVEEDDVKKYVCTDRACNTVVIPKENKK